MLSSTRKPSLLMAAVSAVGGSVLLNGLMSSSIPGAPPRHGPSALSKRLLAAGQSYAQWPHAMLTSTREEIQLHNSTVRRRNRAFAKRKGLN